MVLPNVSCRKENKRFWFLTMSDETKKKRGSDNGAGDRLQRTATMAKLAVDDVATGYGRGDRLWSDPLLHDHA